MTETRAPMNELGFYTLAGHSDSPRDLLDEVREAEALGLGSVFVSERFNVKEAATLCGAAGAATTRLGIATAATNHNTRHPLVTGAFAATMHRLTGGRFALGLGRGIKPMFQAFSIPPITFRQMEDFIGLMRRLWKGEQIFGHDGPAGRYNVLSLDPSFDEDIPILLTAMGPKMLEFAGAHADAVVLHTFFSDETLARCVTAVRRGAERAGRDPAAVRVWSCFATVGDHLPYESRLVKTVGRMATYLQAYGDLLVAVNGWDPAELERFRRDPLVAGFRGAIDATATTEQLEHLAKLIPEPWLAASATGSPERCAARVAEQLAIGADGVILHGATPSELEPVVEAYRGRRPGARFAGAQANPGR